MELIAKRAGDTFAAYHRGTGVYGTYVQGVAGRADPAPGHGNSGDGSCGVIQETPREKLKFFLKS